MPTYRLTPGGVPAVLRGLGASRVNDVHTCWGYGSLHGGHTSDHLGLAGDPQAAGNDGELFDQDAAMQATVEVYRGPLTLDLCFRGNNALSLTGPSLERMRQLADTAGARPNHYPLGVGLWPYLFAVDAAKQPSIEDLLDRCRDEWKVAGVQWASFGGLDSNIQHAGMPEADWAEVPKLLKSRNLQLFGVAAGNHDSAPHTGDTDVPWRTQFAKNLRFTVAAYGPDHKGKKVLRVDGVEDPSVLGAREGFPPPKKTVEPKAAFARWVSNLQWGCDEAAKVGVTITYEGEPGFVYHTLAEWIALHEAVNRPNFGYQADWSHLDHAARGTKFAFAA